MGFSLTHFTAILIFSALIITRITGELDVLRHYPISNGTAIKLTCVSEDDGAALVWNLDQNGKDFNNGQKIDILTNFQPKNPTTKNLTECAIWNSTKCFALWGKKSGWNVVDSAHMPMGPIFDYRWEGLEEIILEKSMNHTEYQYIGTMRDYSGTVIFSVRGSSEIHIFLCEDKEPRNGQCFWIIIGNSKGKRSEIRSCVNDREKSTGGYINEENCMAVASVVHGAEDVLDAYAWRTFRLEWNGEKKVIRIFNETEVEPFLDGNLDRWHPVSHLSMKSELLSRIRFHFYDYFLTKNNNSVISTAEFIFDDENFCVEALVGLCPECKLNVGLVDDENRDIPIASISGEGRSVHDKLVTWRSVRINPTLPNFNSRLVKLKIVTILMKNEVEGLWAIDKFRRCKSIVGLRKSTITVDRELMDTANPFWPTVKCQKLSYTENIIVDSISGNPYRDRGGLVLKRKSRAETTEPPCSAVKLEIYEADLKKKSISLRLEPLHSTQYGIEQYVVSITRQTVRTRTYNVSQELECSRWKESVCLENFLLPNDTNFDGSNLILVTGKKNGQDVNCTWEEQILTVRHDQDANKPTNLTWDYESHGIVTLKWGYPSLPKTKIERFNINIARKTSRLFQNPPGNGTMHYTIVVTEVKKEYTKTLHLLPSSTYTIDIKSINQNNSESDAATVEVEMPSGVNFAKSELEVTNNGTWIELKIPAVVNVTGATYIEVSMKGTWKCKTANNMTERIVWEYQVLPIHDKNNTFDANETMKSSGMIDCFLDHGETYEIIVKVVEKNSNSTITLPSRFITLPSIDGETMPQERGSQMIWLQHLLIAIGILLILSFLIFISYKHKQKCSIEKSESKTLPIADNEYHHITSRISNNSTPPSDSASNRLSTWQSPPDVVPYIPHNPHSCLVKTEDFEEHVKEGLASGLLQSQYEKFPRGLIKPCEYGRLPENMQKNRYKNLIAYDDTRVILKKVGDDPYSDYINASYIQGYKKERAYIATQGPKPQTVRDFWRMIWEEDVRVICMLANVKEGGKIKCEHYWPEVGSRAKYGDILVTNMNHQVFADYTFRTFRLDCNKVYREVTHLHYTGWPDHGIPMYTQSLVSYLKKLQDTSTGNGPVVVHCSAGVGRTGTIILCDICLKQAFAEKTVDVPGVTASIRDSRANMVDSAQQFLLANLTIMESLVVEQTQIPCSNVLAKRIKELRKNLPSDIQRLNDTVWQDRALHDLAAPTRPTPVDVGNNGISEPTSGIPSVTESEAYNGENNSINAVSVDGVKMKKQHLASRLPTVSTLHEFWKLIYERRIELVVILERPDEKDTTFCDLMPDESILIPVSPLKVERKTILIKEDHYLIDKLLLSDTTKENEKPHPVTVVTCNGWGQDKEERKPPTAHALVSLWQASEKIPRKESPTLTLCRDGVTGCGLYLALSFLLERMAVERECDVISAVRAVRRSKPEFVQSLKQFEYLYDAAVQYNQCFDTYSNFS